MTKRRSFSPEFKVRVVLELISGEKGLMQASREYGIKDTVLSRCKAEFLERAVQLFKQPQDNHHDQERIAELDRMVGRLTMQLDMAKKVLRYSNSPPKGAHNGGRFGSVFQAAGTNGLPTGGAAAQYLLLQEPEGR
jgi:transposase-like protein